MRLLLLPNLRSPDARAFALSLRARFAGRHKVLFPPDEAMKLGLPPAEVLREEASRPESAREEGASGAARPGEPLIDFALPLGGDGTILRRVPLLARLGAPVLAVNFGQVGYLCSCDPAHFEEYFARALAGRARARERLLLAGQTSGGGSFLALNEAVVRREGIARALKMTLTVGGRRIYRSAADGILAATPTGSTAYNRSAGGPLLLPESRLLTLTPLSPVSPDARALVTESGIGEITLDFLLEDDAGGDLLLTADGCRALPLGQRATVTLRAARETLTLFERDARET